MKALQRKEKKRKSLWQLRVLVRFLTVANFLQLRRNSRPKGRFRQDSESPSSKTGFAFPLDEEDTWAKHSCENIRVDREIHRIA